MRLRTVFLSLASAFALVFTVSGTASAADGEFTYRFHDEDDVVHGGSLIDPPSGECQEIPEVADLEDTYAFRPHNATNSIVMMFKESGCEGDDYYSLKPGGRASSELKLRSVVFS